MCPVSVIQVRALFGNLTSLKFRYSTNWPATARPNEGAARRRPRRIIADGESGPADTVRTLVEAITIHFRSAEFRLFRSAFHVHNLSLRRATPCSLKSYPMQANLAFAVIRAVRESRDTRPLCRPEKAGKGSQVAILFFWSLSGFALSELISITRNTASPLVMPCAKRPPPERKRHALSNKEGVGG
jgi:hypothetical protein